MVKLLEEFGAGCSIIAVVFLEAISVSWFYGKIQYINSYLLFVFTMVCVFLGTAILYIMGHIY